MTIVDVRGHARASTATNSGTCADPGNDNIRTKPNGVCRLPGSQRGDGSVVWVGLDGENRAGGIEQNPLGI